MISWRIHPWMKVEPAPPCSTAQHSTAQHSTALHCTALHTHHQPAELQRGGHVCLGGEGIAQRAQRAAPNLQAQHNTAVAVQSSGWLLRLIRLIGCTG